MMSLEECNNLMSGMLKTRQALAKTRSELEGREGRKCWGCREFGHLAKNCRNKGGRVKKEMKKGGNRFKALASRVMQCGVREVRKIAQQEGEEVVQYFRCWGRGHYKWECPNIEVEKERRRKE